MDARTGNGNGDADGAVATAKYRRRAEDHQELAARNLAFGEFESLRSSHPTADAFFAALDVYRRELSYLAVKRMALEPGGR